MTHNPHDKQRDIVAMFDDIAQRYDMANRILSFGIDTQWRKEACKRTLELCEVRSNRRIVDVACGTGDMMINWLKYAPDSRVIGIDPSANMLQIARTKLPPSAQFIKGEAKNLAIADASADILSITYGLRNVVEIDAALGEFHRALGENGLLVILEFTKKDKENIFDKIALFYTRRILPIFGGLISKNYAAYKYLPDSVSGFLTLESLEAKLAQIGFKTLFKKRYVANLCSLIILRKIAK